MPTRKWHRRDDSTAQRSKPAPSDRGRNFPSRRVEASNRPAKRYARG